MTLQDLTEEIAIRSLKSFFRDPPFLFFGSGMSCALDSRFGMLAFKDSLIAEMQRSTLTCEQKIAWNSVVEAINGGTDLERALNTVVDQDILGIITDVTGSFIASVDKEFAYRIF